MRQPLNLQCPATVRGHLRRVRFPQRNLLLGASGAWIGMSRRVLFRQACVKQVASAAKSDLPCTCEGRNPSKTLENVKHATASQLNKNSEDTSTVRSIVRRHSPHRAPVVISTCCHLHIKKNFAREKGTSWRNWIDLNPGQR